MEEERRTSGDKGDVLIKRTSFLNSNFGVRAQNLLFSFHLISFFVEPFLSDHFFSIYFRFLFILHVFSSLSI